MKESFKNLLKLVEKAHDYLSSELKYNPKTVRDYKQAWSGIIDYMVTNEIDSYNELIEKRFLLDSFGDRKKRELITKERYSYNGAKMLTQFCQTGKIDSPHHIPRFKKAIVFSPVFETVVNEFFNYRKEIGITKSHLRTYKRGLHNFFNYCEKNHVTDIQSIELPLMLNYLRDLDKKKDPCIQTVLLSLRGFMKYAFLEGLIAIDYSSKLPKYRSISQPQLPSVYSSEEIENLIHSVDRSSHLGKRNYAIILLAARLGLRAGNISNLKFSNLCWQTSKITIRQVKTGKELILPLLPDVGNAIIDYLKYSRPESEEPFVFLMGNSHSPFPSSGPVTIIVQNAFRRAGINIRNRKFGAHSLRHSLSARLLENKTTLPVIAEVLGHSNTESTKYYLRIDLTAMQQCILEVPSVSINFYQQKGGIFYGK